ncbi:MAG TPA: hypothetical protein PLF22_06260 [Pseudomonadales bacterium]|nr:hypothetical protein [Pseudomonadales bacterium]
MHKHYGFSRAVAFSLLILGVAGCATHQEYSTTQVQAISLTHESLVQDGIAFITPSSITGQEEDRQSLAQSFVLALRDKRPDLHVVSLPETLGAINSQGLSAEYKSMFVDYGVTGIFDRDKLRNVSAVAGARYLAQLKLQGFQQDAKGRWGALGFRILETKVTRMRLFLQIWDSRDGSIAWEGSQELLTAREKVSEDGMSFRNAAQFASESMIGKLP